MVDLLPVVPVVRVVGAAIVHRAWCLATQRGPQMSEPLKWELPGGKIEPGENSSAALRREIREELSLEIEVGERLGGGSSIIGGRRIELEVLTATVTGGRLRLTQHCRCGWLGAEQLERLDWSAADRPVLAALKRLLSSL